MKFFNKGDHLIIKSLNAQFDNAQAKLVNQNPRTGLCIVELLHDANPYVKGDIVGAYVDELRPYTKEETVTKEYALNKVEMTRGGALLHFKDNDGKEVTIDVLLTVKCARPTIIVHTAGLVDGVHVPRLMAANEVEIAVEKEYT